VQHKVPVDNGLPGVKQGAHHLTAVDGCLEHRYICGTGQAQGRCRRVGRALRSSPAGAQPNRIPARSCCCCCCCLPFADAAGHPPLLDAPFHQSGYTSMSAPANATRPACTESGGEAAVMNAQFEQSFQEAAGKMAGRPLQQLCMCTLQPIPPIPPTHLCR
jgi:hypothetical protein